MARTACLYSHGMEANPTTEAVDAFIQNVDYPLYVLTVGGDGDQRSGCIVGFASQCSIVPPRFLVCVSKVNHTYGVAERAPGFALHLLTSEQTDLAHIFAEETGRPSSRSAQPGSRVSR
jgi:flavin reductase (DIM6/NTAB) family NADH-FMN oxidoreductase RutF